MSRPIHGDDVFRAVAHATRRQILDLLIDQGDLSPTEIMATLSLTPTSMSNHLRMLRDAKLVLQRRAGRRRLYRANAKRLGVITKWADRADKRARS